MPASTSIRISPTILNAMKDIAAQNQRSFSGEIRVALIDHISRNPIKPKRKAVRK